MNIFDQIDNIFSGECDTKPQWANELLQEIKEIKLLLQEQKELLNQKRYSVNTTYKKPDNNFYRFVKEFRVSMKADTKNSIYPTFEYDGKKLGVDYSGLLYDKTTSKTLSKDEAFRVYKFAYKNRFKHKVSA